MNLSIGRVRHDTAASKSPSVASSPIPTPRTGQVVPKMVVDASLRAAAILADAQARADRALADAESSLSAFRERVADEARADGVAHLAAQTLAFRALEAAQDERALDRVLSLSRMLAERLLGEVLAVEPARVVALARQALEEARGARRITIVAHPDDAPLLDQALAEGRLQHVTRVVADGSRERGSLRLETEIGTLDAELGPQLERLTQHLRQALHHDS